jgi:hypothetical protein
VELVTRRRVNEAESYAHAASSTPIALMIGVTPSDLDLLGNLRKIFP